MLKNITIGQYIVGNSFLHKATPKSKLLVIFSFTFILFFFNKILTYLFGFFVVLLVYKSCKIPLKVALNNLKSLAVILSITSIFNLFFGKDGEVIFKFYFLEVTKNSLHITILIIVRMFLLIVGMAILTYTTLALDLARSFGDLFLPLKRFNFPVGEISTMLSIAIRFVPLLVSETEKIIMAQKSRGASQNSKSLKKKINFVISILVPLLVSSFKRAEELAVAMESRCYEIGAKRTRYIEIKANKNDFILIFSAVVFFFSLFLVEKISYF